MIRQITDMETWLRDNEGRVFRYLVYRRMFTPREQQEAYIDESYYEDAHYEFCLIEEAVEIEGDWLLGLRTIDDVALDDGEIKPYGFVVYYRLSELRLSCFDKDQPDYEEQSGQ